MINTVRDICKFLSQHLPDKPVCIETGTMYTCPEGNEVHTTTNNLLEFVCAGKGDLYSLDIDKEHVAFSENFCCNLPSTALYFIGDSVQSLKSLARKTFKVNLLCLDSKEFDEDHMVNEYEAIAECLAEKHYVLVDDIHNENSVKYKKMVPELLRLGYETIEISTPTGMLIATKGLPLPAED